MASRVQSYCLGCMTTWSSIKQIQEISLLRLHLATRFGLLASPRRRISDVKACDRGCVVAVDHYYWICSPLDVLEQLNDKNPAIICAKDHAGKVR